MLTPDALLPQIGPEGQLLPVEQVFASHQLEDTELYNLVNLAVRLQGLNDMMGSAIGLGRDNLARDMPWLDEWANQMDSWVSENGLLLPVPIDLHDDEEDFESGGKLEAAVNVDQPTPDHMDTFRHMPVGLSIGLQGRRELVGVAFDSLDEAFEARKKLSYDNEQLANLEEFEGKEVQRITQDVGQVIHIGSFATLHSGKPMEYVGDGGQSVPNAAFIIGHLSPVASGSEQIAETHMQKWYKPADYIMRDSIFGSQTVTGVY